MSEESRKMEPTLRSASFEGGNRIYRFDGKGGCRVCEKKQQTLNREDRADWRDTQKRHAEDKKMQAHAEVELEKV